MTSDENCALSDLDKAFIPTSAEKTLIFNSRISRAIA
jgi:hypothetical protein